MVIGKHREEVTSVASRKGVPLMVAFNSKSGNYRGLIRITGGPRDVGQFYSIEFTGIDVLTSS